MTRSPTLAMRAARALAWGTASQVGRQVVQLAVFLALVRLLDPADFGIMAMVAALTGFMSVVSELGVGSALIQARQVTDGHRNAMFWMSLASGLLVGAAVYAAAPAAAAFLAEPRVTPLMRIMALSFPIAALSVVHGALLQRELRLRNLAVIELMATVVGGAVAITLAVRGYGALSLAWQPPAAAAVTAVAFWLRSTWHPVARIHSAAVHDLFGFSWRLTAFNISNYVVRNTDDLLVGRYLGATALGFYGRAYALLMLPVTAITAVVGRVLVPTLAELRDQPLLAKSAYLRALEGVAFVSFPIMFGLLVVAEDFVLTLLGPAWLGMVPVLRIFAALGLAQSIATSTGWIFQSQGRADQLLRWGLIAGPVLIGSYVVGILFGTIEGVAASYAIASGIVLFYPAFAYPGRLIQLRVSEVLKRVLPVFACAAGMAAVVALLASLLPGTWSPPARLLVCAAAGIISYAIAAFAVPLAALASAREAIVLLTQGAPAPGFIPLEIATYERL